MKEEPNHSPIDPLLEARIVALVLGEASDFERDELGRLIDEHPELAAFKQQMQAVHGLLEDVGAGESVAEDEDWKLSARRRDTVLSTIRGEAKQQSRLQLAGGAADRLPSKSSGFVRNLAKIAAVLLVAGFCGSMLLSTLKVPSISASRRVASSETRDMGAESLMGELYVPSDEMFMADGSAVATENEEYSRYLRVDDLPRTVEPDSIDRSKSSLSGIRESLDVDVALAAPHDRNDDARFSPAESDVNLSQATPAAPATVFAAPVVEPAPADSAGVPAEDSQGLEVSGGDRLNRVQAGQAAANGRPRAEVRAQMRSARPQPPEQSSEDFAPAAQDFKSEGWIASMDALSWHESHSVDAEDGDGDSVFDAGNQDANKRIESLGDRRLAEAKQENRPQLEMPALEAQESDPSPSRQRNVVVDELADRSGRARFGGAVEGDAGVTAGEPLGEASSSGLTREPNLQFSGDLAADSPSKVRGIEDLTRDAERLLREDWEKQQRVEKSRGEGVAAKGKTSTSWSVPLERDEIAEVKELNGNEAAKYFKKQNGAWFYDGESKTASPASKAAAPAGLNEKSAAEEAFSTFSLHVSDVSFKLARNALARGSWPEAGKVRIEEFVNAFDYGDPMPSQNEKVACRVEQSVHPFLQQRNLLRISMRTAAAGRSSSTPLRLTLLLDNSGSMERIDRQQTVRRAFALLVGQLKPIDQVTLVSFARQPRLLADKVGGDRTQQLLGLIENLPSEGGTNIEAALQLAFEKAREQKAENAQNRIILLTDGAVNLGDADPDSLSRMILTMRAAGIAFDAAGISAEGLNDEILEALTRKGDGRYYLLDSQEAADEGFVRQVVGALRPAAGNVKVQVEFNPRRVGRYKLLGFEKHRLEQEDFRRDKVDAAEMAAAEAGVALYQFEAKPDGEGDVGSVSVRFRDLSTQQMVELCWPIPYALNAPRLDQAAPSLRIAATAALLAAKLRGDAVGHAVDLKTLSNLVAGLPDQTRKAQRVEQLQQMIELARQVSGK